MVVGNNRKRKSLTDIESLPDEVLFEVLVRLPAQDIHDSVRLVCSKWYRMTRTHTFIYAHLQHSTYGLLFQSKDKDPFFMAVGESGRVEISKNSYNKLRCQQPFFMGVGTSCNGLVLESKEHTNNNIYVSNPATRQIIHLRPLVGYRIASQLFAIGYAAASMKYKAIVLFTPGQGMKKICCILTIGVDNSWRTIGKGSVSLAATHIYNRTPLITEGFLHWYDIYSNKVLTLNVETEIFTETSGPTTEGYQRNTYLSTGRYLSLLRPCGEFCWEVWEMKPKIDYRLRKVWDISFEDNKCSTFQRFKSYEFLFPIGWLKYLEILVFFTLSFGIHSQVVVYNLLTHEIVTIELPVPAPRSDYDLVVHKDSLVSLGGC
ncbi:hypothetical protein CASFOL_030998 [Castilleja foliolosa]|uniref:F-box domain-containing protein n=1 Tax=Castilleja foliolosa TaxID=1961234 RepID=A0ABD3C7J4_9LAMI